MGIDYGYNIKKTMTYVMGWYPEVSTWLAQWKIPQLDQWFSQQTPFSSGIYQLVMFD